METDGWYLRPDLTAARRDMLEAHEVLKATLKGSHAYAGRLELAQKADRAYLRLFTDSLLAEGCQPEPGPMRLALVSAQRSAFDRR